MSFAVALMPISGRATRSPTRIQVLKEKQHKDMPNSVLCDRLVTVQYIFPNLPRDRDTNAVLS